MMSIFPANSRLSAELLEGGYRLHAGPLRRLDFRQASHIVILLLRQR
jgi:hypothetical protein